MSSLQPILEYGPVVAGAALNCLAVWACWSLRQLAKTEVAKAVELLEDKDQKLADQIDGHDTRMTQIEGRLGAAEQDIRDLPTRADLARLEGEVKAVAQGVNAANGGIQRLENFFLEKGVR